MAQSPAYHHAPVMEREVAARTGGRKTEASGARDEKGDVRIKGIARLECKATSRNSFTVTREMLDKISAAAETAGELPIVVVQFLPTAQHAGGSVVVCPEYLLQCLQTNP